MILDHQDQNVTITPKANLIAPGTASVLSRVVEFLEGKSVLKLTFNMQHVKMVDSSGIGILVSLYKTLKEREAELILSSCRPSIVKLFKMMRLDRHFTILSDV